MARTKFLKTLVEQAERNGFLFHSWYTASTGEAWQSAEKALEHLARGRNYYTLLFSHEFACAFWKQGTRVTFLVPSATYCIRDKKGKLIQVQRKPYTKRRLKPDAWKYHLREMACADEPLRYIRRFVLVAPEAAAEAAAKRRLASRSVVALEENLQK